MPQELELSTEGVRARAAITGEAFNAASVASIDAFTREWAEFRTNQLWARTWARGVLTHRQMSFLSMGVLSGRDRLEEVEIHIEAALSRTGLSIDEVREVLLHITLRCGIPVGREVFMIAQRILGQLGLEAPEKPRIQNGPPTSAATPLMDAALAARRAATGDPAVDLALSSLTGLDREWFAFTTNQLYGRTWDSVLAPGDLALLDMGILAGQRAFGPFGEALRDAVVRCGVSPEEVREALLHIGLYAGVTAGDQAFDVARRVFLEERLALAD